MKRRYIFIIIAIAFLAFIIFNSLYVIRPSITGVVVDSITNKPIIDIKVERIIDLHNLGDGGLFPISYSEIIYTNNYGQFQFPKKRINKFLMHFNRDWINTNTKENYGYIGWSSKGNPENTKYYPNATGNIEKFKEYEGNITIRLIPQVDDIRECENNEECIRLNSFDLALKNNNESLCLYIPFENKEYTRISERYQCITYFVAMNNDTALCKYLENNPYCFQDSYVYDEYIHGPHRNQDYLFCRKFDVMPNNEQKYYLCRERIAKQMA